MATQAEIDELFQQTLEGDYDDEDDEGGPWEAISTLQAIASDESEGRAGVYRIEAVQMVLATTSRPSSRQQAWTSGHRRSSILQDRRLAASRRGRSLYAEESYPIVVGVLEDELDLEVIDSCLVALGHLGNPEAVPLILEHRTNSDPDVRFAVAFGLSCFADDPAAIRVLLELMEDSDKWRAC